MPRLWTGASCPDCLELLTMEAPLIACHQSFTPFIIPSARNRNKSVSQFQESHLTLLLIPSFDTFTPPWRTATRSPSQHSRPGMCGTSVCLTSNHVLTHCSGKLVQIEYALNAVNQGVTSLGIKGGHVSFTHEPSTKLTHPQHQMASSSRPRRSPRRRSSMPHHHQRSRSSLPTSAWSTPAWVPTTAFS